jgi:hypothetical protein
MKNYVSMIAVVAAFLLPAGALAQNYAINWYKVSGGGGTGTGGTYQLGGTIGHHDASGAMTGLGEGRGMVLVLVTLQ